MVKRRVIRGKSEAQVRLEAKGKQPMSGQGGVHNMTQSVESLGDKVMATDKGSDDEDLLARQPLGPSLKKGDSSKGVGNPQVGRKRVANPRLKGSSPLLKRKNSLRVHRIVFGSSSPNGPKRDDPNTGPIFTQSNQHSSEAPSMLLGTVIGEGPIREAAPPDMSMLEPPHPPDPPSFARHLDFEGGPPSEWW